jgi:hypothetical protein
MSGSEASDLRALARVILEREELEQSFARPARLPYEVAPVQRRATEGARVGLLLGLALGAAPAEAGAAASSWTPRSLAFLVVFVVAGPALGACAGALGGIVVRATQRRRLDDELCELVGENR